MEKLETSYGSFSVYINKLISPEGLQFHLSFVDNRNKTQIVVMKKSTGGLEFVNPESLPDWIKGLDSQFSHLITKHVLENYSPAIVTSV